MSKTEFCLGAPFRGGSALAKNIVDFSKHAEVLGYDAISTKDHIHMSLARHQYYAHGIVQDADRANEPNMFESISTIAYLAGICPTLKFQTAVLFLPARDPVVLAKQVATIDALTGGRIILTVGVGNITDSEEFNGLGLPLKSRWQIGEESLAAMQEIWTKPISSYHGNFVNFEGLSIYPKPVSKPHTPLWFGGKSPRALRTVARYCSGWLPQFLPPEEQAQGFAKIKELARECGRSQVEFTMGAQFYVSLSDDHDEAEARWNARLPPSEELARYTGYLHETGGNAQAEHTRRALIGSPSQIVEMLDPYLKVGVSLFEVHFVYTTIGGLFGQMRQFARDVVPSIR
jgi:probable F420-dependent oxidoreductase